MLLERSSKRIRLRFSCVDVGRFVRIVGTLEERTSLMDEPRESSRRCVRWASRSALLAVLELEETRCVVGLLLADLLQAFGGALLTIGLVAVCVGSADAGLLLS